MKLINLIRLISIFAIAGVFATVSQASELTTLKNCKRVPTEWADGDSFLIETEDGTQYTVRLYGADCLEWHVTDGSDARRLREQRRYFGISEFGGSPQASIEAAKGFGKAAADEIAIVLKEPFSVHTAFSDGRGDGRYKRIYAFVTTSEGQDLAEHLVSVGLARAFGVYRATPKGQTSKEYRAVLQDVELRAAKQGAGAWAKTDWDRLLAERQSERQENDELSLATATPKLAKGETINPNTAARDQLMLLPGVGEVTALRIIEARPYKTIQDLLTVDGIGPKTFERLEPFLKLP